jgi:dTDP-4-amino-4,6-dideoxygalactose transaminase
VHPNISSHALKSRVEELAIFGGTPAFAYQLHVGRPNLGNRQALLGRIEELLDRKCLTNDGPFLQESEQRLCELVSVKHCVAVCNATIGLEVLASSLCAVALLRKV